MAKRAKLKDVKLHRDDGAVRIILEFDNGSSHQVELELGDDPKQTKYTLWRLSNAIRTDPELDAY